HITILNHPIKQLRPQTLLSNKTKMILVYLPSKIEEKGSQEPEFSNKAFFVVRKNGEKKVLPIEDEDLKSNFKIDVLSTWNESRWSLDDLNEWLNTLDAIDPINVFNLQYEQVKHYFEFESEAQYKYFTLWNIGTYFFNIF